MSVEPDISVSLVNTDNRELLLACLESLPGAAEGITLQTIVIDNASTDGSADGGPRALPGRRGGRARARHGFGANHNEAIRAVDRTLRLDPERGHRAPSRAR